MPSQLEMFKRACYAFPKVKIWWQKLAWPDPENSAVLLTKILEDICSCVLSYSNLIREKVKLIFHQHENSTRVFITEHVRTFIWELNWWRLTQNLYVVLLYYILQFLYLIIRSGCDFPLLPQICIGLNNIERVRTEMVNLPTQFGFHELLQKIRTSDNGGSAAAQLEATVERLIINAADNMEAKVNEFIDAMLDKVSWTASLAVGRIPHQLDLNSCSHSLHPILVCKCT